MYTVTEAKPKLHALVADAHDGRTSHIVKGSQVVAHLVTPTARIIDDEHLMDSISLALLNQEAEFLATIWRDSDFHGHAGDVVGRFFAWAWSTDKQLFMKCLSRYHEYLCTKLQRQFNAVEVLDLLDDAMEVRLSRTESDDACRYGVSHAPDYFYYQLP
ncbi:hypothetical protein JF770_21130 [Mycobacterium intracellulare]|uniref:hypothetical protein n=1 Tax=Mycobacterium intracellulare TaxID=1767 RepID=UPI001CD9CD9C|nr:hypothetical protein [Mycobacterium intracellulare]MCA2306071.1 hypothetical protein [Mycobacterium intracellulare]MCA2348298.1 hypothetical protein [Mycobacterium intracellulare]